MFSVSQGAEDRLVEFGRGRAPQLSLIHISSGTVFHAFLGEKLPDWKAAAKLVRTIAENYRLPYYSISPTYSICKDHGYLSGEHFSCPVCGKEAEVYSRITGYYRPVKNWNEGKRCV